MDKKIAGQLKKFEREFDALVKGEEKEFNLGPFSIRLVFYWVDGVSVYYSFVNCTFPENSQLTESGKLMINIFLDWDGIIEDSVSQFLHHDDNEFIEAHNDFQERIYDFNSRLSEFCDRHDLDTSEVYNKFDNKHVI